MMMVVLFSFSVDRCNMYGDSSSFDGMLLDEHVVDAVDGGGARRAPLPAPGRVAGVGGEIAR